MTVAGALELLFGCWSEDEREMNWNVWNLKREEIFLVRLENPNSHSHSSSSWKLKWIHWGGWRENAELWARVWGEKCERDENGTIILMNLNLNRVWLIDWFFSLFALYHLSHVRQVLSERNDKAWENLLVNPPGTHTEHNAGQGDDEIDKLKLSSLVFVCFFIPSIRASSLSPDTAKP